jgi:hypothetical protein
MFSKFRKYMVLAVVSVASLAIVGQAAASTAVVSPGGNVTGSAGASQLILSTQARTVNCTTSTATATVAGATGTLPLTISSNLRPAFSGCTITGGLTVTVLCQNSNLLATAVTDGSGVTQGRITNINCNIRLSGTCAIDVTGSVDGQYTNSTAVLRVFGTGATESLRAARSSGSTCSTLVAEPVAIFRGVATAALDYAITPAQTIRVT